MVFAARCAGPLSGRVLLAGAGRPRAPAPGAGAGEGGPEASRQCLPRALRSTPTCDATTISGQTMSALLGRSLPRGKGLDPSPPPYPPASAVVPRSPLLRCSPALRLALCGPRSSHHSAGARAATQRQKGTTSRVPVPVSVKFTVYQYRCLGRRGIPTTRTRPDGDHDDHEALPHARVHGDVRGVLAAAGRRQR